MTSRWARRRPRGLKRLWRPLAAIAVAALIAVAIEVSGSIGEGRAALIYMGFDPARARLIAALCVEAIVVAIAAFATGLSLVPSVAGIGLFGAMYARSFAAETHAALTSNAVAGRFDPIGWLVTLGTLIGSAIVVAWAAATLATVLRSATVHALDDLRLLIRDHGPRRKVVRPSLLFAAIAALAIAGPVFTDMVNYDPDVHMRVGGDQPVGLVNAGAQPPPITSQGSTVGNGGTNQLILPPSGAAQGDEPVLSATRPWLAWRPSGSGRVIKVTFPAPWTGGLQNEASIWVYTPPGYDTTDRRYPVIYEVPWGNTGWGRIGTFNILDAMTDTGAIPGHVTVFVSETGGPYPDSECMDSPDHREHIETYLTQTVVPYIDATYRTIAAPAGRSLLGMSQGGYCVAMLALRHPNLFATAMAFSGYYEAAIQSAQTVNAALPFDGDKAAITSHSPMSLVEGYDRAVGRRLLFELSADPTSPFYGIQYQRFAAALKAAGIPTALFPTPFGHAWQAPRTQLPEILTTLAAHEVALGAFGA